MINIKFFASFREELGIESLTFETEFPLTVSDLIAQLKEDDKKFSLLTNGIVLVAINQEITGFDAQIAANDEVAFFPPVTGG